MWRSGTLTSSLVGQNRRIAQAAEEIWATNWETDAEEKEADLFTIVYLLNKQNYDDNFSDELIREAHAFLCGHKDEKSKWDGAKK